MLMYPEIEKIAFELGPLKVHWYGLMYILGFGLGWLLLRYRSVRSQGVWTDEHVSDIVFFGALGVILGGRIGYVLFYNFDQFLIEPARIFYLWQGGMSFHGGLIGVLLAFAWFAKKHKKHYLDVADFVAPTIPVGLATGRLGNFINGELWGRATDMPWGMVFERVGGGPMPRHPSQLYELFLEGFVLLAALWWFSSSPRRRGAVSGWFLIGYGVFRSFVEFFREPDAHLNFVAFGWMTMGQALCLPMILAGCALLFMRNEGCGAVCGSRPAS